MYQHVPMYRDIQYPPAQVYITPKSPTKIYAGLPPYASDNASTEPAADTNGHRQGSVAYAPVHSFSDDDSDAYEGDDVDGDQNSLAQVGWATDSDSSEEEGGGEGSGIGSEPRQWFAILSNWDVSGFCRGRHLLNKFGAIVLYKSSSFLKDLCGMFSRFLLSTLPVLRCVCPWPGTTPNSARTKIQSNASSQVSWPCLPLM